jgi:hypothetical protein
VTDRQAQLLARRIEPSPESIGFEVSERATGEQAAVQLQMPGVHNVSNALAALCAARACGVSFRDAAHALVVFSGIKRRFERVGATNGVTVFDDFAHNPDKIAATLATLHAFPGRLLVLFQPHGFGPLKLMKDAFIDCFTENLREDDVLVMPEPVYYGGTVERAVTSEDIVRGVAAGHRQAFAFPDRSACGDKLIALADPATASSSWARATTPWRNSPPTCCGGWLRRREPRPEPAPARIATGISAGRRHSFFSPRPLWAGIKGAGSWRRQAPIESRGAARFRLTFRFKCSYYVPTCRGRSDGRLGAPRSIFDIVYQSTFERTRPPPEPARLENRPVNFLLHGLFFRFEKS